MSFGVNIALHGGESVLGESTIIETNVKINDRTLSKRNREVVPT